MRMFGLADLWPLAGIAVGIAVGIAAAGLALLALRTVRVQAARLAEGGAVVDELRRRIDAMTVLQTRTVTRLQRLEAEQSRIAERVALAESGGGRVLDDAIDSARRGASIGALVETFGLSRGEASLIARLHGRPEG